MHQPNRSAMYKPAGLFEPAGLGVLVCVVLAFRALAAAAHEEDRGRESPTREEIRRLAENPEQPMHDKLLEDHIRGVSSSWLAQSKTIDTPGDADSKTWSGVVGHGTPIPLDEHTFAIVEDRGGVSLALWHLDTTGPSLKRIGALNEVRVSDIGTDGFHSVTWFKSKEGPRGEFVCLAVGRNPKNITKWDGQILVSYLDLRSGRAEAGVPQSLRFIASEAKLRELLLAKVPKQSETFLPDAGQALQNIARLLENHGVAFQSKKGEFCLTEDTIRKIRSEVESVECDKPDVLAAIDKASLCAKQYPTCEALRDLDAQLQICRAVVTKEIRGLKQIAFDNSMKLGVSPDRNRRLRSLAAQQALHLIATSTDSVEDYVDIAEKSGSMGLIDVRDRALLRAHELLFQKACQEGTIDAFDRFIKLAPVALQVPHAVDLSYRLAAEQVQEEIESADNPETKRNEIAIATFVDWREALRTGDVLKSRRNFALLRDHKELKVTEKAADAQNAKDEDKFRNEMLERSDRQIEATKAVASIQQQQLRVMGDQLDEQRAMSSSMGLLERQMEYVSRDLRNMNDASQSTSQNVEQIRNLLKRK